MERIYTAVIQDHIATRSQMAFLSGPRQVGKTTLAKNCKKLGSDFKYLNWDETLDREIILSGARKVTEDLRIDAITAQKPIIIFDEIHKYKLWKNYLKGFIDQYKGKLNIIVTGSSKLNVFRRGGDSLMGRYFLYRVHPLSVGELLHKTISETLLSKPSKLKESQFDALLQFGGYPEPFLAQETRFYNQWQNLRQEQLFKEDIRDLAQIQDLAQMEMLGYHLQHQASQLVNYSNLATKVQVSNPTIRRWINVMESFYYCFTIPPWSKNISRSLVKEPKIYLWDWSLVKEEGAKLENLTASHLLKAVHFWTDLGFGKFGLYFLRDKEKKEVDFLIVKDNKPWMLIEVKNSSKEPLSKHLLHFQSQLNAEYVFQVARDMPYVDFDLQDLKEPKIIPLITFLSQLV